MLVFPAWQQHKLTRSAVKIPADLAGESLVKILAGPRGLEVFAVFVLLLEVSAKCKVQGTLADKSGNPLGPEALASMIRVPQETVEHSIEVLRGVGWIGEADGLPSEKPGKVLDPWCFQAAKAFLNRVRETFPRTRNPSTRGWALEFQALLDAGESKEEVAEVAKWLFTSTQKDAKFWRGVLRSPSGFRRHWPTLHGQCKPGKAQAPTNKAHYKEW